MTDTVEVTGRMQFGCLKNEVPEASEDSEVTGGNTMDVVSVSLGGGDSVVRPEMGENATIPLPSSGCSDNQEKAPVSGRTEGARNKCLMKNMRCKKHECDVVRVKTKAKKWVYLEKKKQWGYKHSTSVQLICKSGGDSDVNLNGQTQDSQIGTLKGKVRKNFHWRKARRLESVIHYDWLRPGLGDVKLILTCLMSKPVSQALNFAKVRAFCRKNIDLRGYLFIKVGINKT